MPLTVWLLAAGFRDLPRKLKETAADGGASPLSTFYRLILGVDHAGSGNHQPVAFITGWNGFLWSVGFTSNDKYRAVPIAMSLFGNVGFSVVVAMAAALTIGTPLVLLTLIFSANRLLTQLARSAPQLRSLGGLRARSTIWTGWR